MSAEQINAFAALIEALAWPIAIIIAIILIRRIIMRVIFDRGEFQFKFREFELAIQPAEGIRPPSGATEATRAELTKDVGTTGKGTSKALPFDYYFLNHTSFLRPKMQAEFQQKTGVPLNHYDIRVIVDSYYRGALERVERVEYILHSSYPNPIQVRTKSEDKFLLKELANGEYVLMAKVFLKDRDEPILLQRYITLWESGPRLS